MRFCTYENVCHGGLKDEEIDEFTIRSPRLLIPPRQFPRRWRRELHGGIALLVHKLPLLGNCLDATLFRKLQGLGPFHHIGKHGRPWLGASYSYPIPTRSAPYVFVFIYQLKFSIKALVSCHIVQKRLLLGLSDRQDYQIVSMGVWRSSPIQHSKEVQNAVYCSTYVF
jgi:hypothetical protein